MKITHYLAPRASGKTTFAENMQKEDPSFLLIERGYCITDTELLFRKFRGAYDSHGCYTGIIIDEFLPITLSKNYDKVELVEWFKYMGVEDIILISTPDKLYDPFIAKDWNEMDERFLVNRDLGWVKQEVIKIDFNNPKYH